MTAPRLPVGARVKAWAERHCDAETLDRLVLPAVADLQYEDSASVGRPGIVRWAIRVRGYVGLGEALGTHLVNRRAASAKASDVAASPVTTSGGGRNGIMSEARRNQLFMIGAGVLVAAVAFVAGRLSIPAPAPTWETPVVTSADASADFRAIQRSIDDQRRETAERDGKLQQELDQQRFDAETERAKAERARIDAETQLSWQKTQQMLDQQKLDAEIESAKAESARRDAAIESAKTERARRDAEMELARQRTQQTLADLIRKQ